MLCLCPRSQLCAACRLSLGKCLRGSASLRGEKWAERVARQRPDLRERPWPAYEGACAAIARRLVADLTLDEILRDELGRTAHETARQWWSGELAHARRDRATGKAGDGSNPGGG